MKKEKGFTLVELLIVVAIIGILAAIAIPQFNKYKVRGYIATLNSDLKNAYTAAQAYLGDNPGSTVDDEAKLVGYRKSKGINFVSANMTTSTGSIILEHAQLNADNADTIAGLQPGQNKVTADGYIPPMQAK